LLDDVMSELDSDRRGRLVDLLDGPGQVVITAATEESVPAALRGNAIRMPIAASSERVVEAA
jgi:DNA replication and repair protein RecF